MGTHCPSRIKQHPLLPYHFTSPIMPSLLIIVFVLQLIIHLVGALGATTMNNVVSDHLPYSSEIISYLLTAINQLWDFYNRLPTSTAKGAREQRQLRRELVRVRQEMNNTSSQDEFAKWAKLRRQHDKLQAELERTCTLFMPPSDTDIITRIRNQPLIYLLTI